MSCDAKTKRELDEALSGYKPKGALPPIHPPVRREFTKEEVKLTAHAMWCDVLRKELKELFYPLRPATKAQVGAIHERVSSCVNNFETTRLRVYVDAIIARLETCSSQMNSLKEEFAKTKRFQFKRRSKIRIELHRYEAMQTAYSQAVLVLTNTQPPREPVNYVQSKMEVTK